MTSSVARPPIGILYVIGSFRFGGSERHLLEVILRLDRERFRPAVAVLQRRGELEESFMMTGVPIHDVGLRRLFSPAGIGQLRKAREFANVHQSRIVHGFHFHGNVLGALLASPDSGRLLITSERGIVDNAKPLQRWARRFYHRRSSRMLVNSKAVRLSVEELSGRRDGWLEVVPNGVDTERFDPDRVSSWEGAGKSSRFDGVTIGHVGRFREEKGQTFMLEAFRVLASRVPQVRFVLVGGGPDSERVAHDVSLPPLASRTTVFDYRDDVRPFLKGMDIFVLPSRTEGMPNALLEAMSMGVACVATRVGGTEELFDQGRAGKLVDYGDVEELARSIGELIEDGGERRRLALAARKRAIEHFSMHTMMQTYHQIYEDELRKSGESTGRRGIQVAFNRIA